MQSSCTDRLIRKYIFPDKRSVEMSSAAEEKLHNGGTSMKIVAPKSDRWNIILLLVIYTIQSVPKGLSDAIPLVLHSRGATYPEQVCSTLRRAIL